MLRFDTAMVVTSNPFNVNRQAVSSHNREMLGDMCEACYGSTFAAGQPEKRQAERRSSI
jgi:hypothetical protein